MANYGRGARTPHHRAFRVRQREKYKSETHALSRQRNAVTGSRLPYSLLGLRSRTIPRIPESGVDFLYLPICLPGDFCVAACARPPQRATARLGQLGTAWSVTNLSEAQALERRFSLLLAVLVSSFFNMAAAALAFWRVGGANFYKLHAYNET